MKDFHEHAEVLVMQVVQTKITRRGRGINEDPIRIITQYWSLDGELLAEVDPRPGAESSQDAYIKWLQQQAV